MATVWKKLDVIGPECEISCEGVVRQKRKTVKGVEKVDVVRKTYVGNGGRRYIQFREGEKTVNKYIHILVAKTFIENPEGLPYVVAIDGDAAFTNSSTKNLKWGDSSDRPPRKKSEPFKLSDSQVKLIRVSGDKQKDLAERFGVSAGLISLIKGGKRHSESE